MQPGDENGTFEPMNAYGTCHERPLTWTLGPTSFPLIETFEKRPLLANLGACPVAPEDGTGVRLEFQSSKYSVYSCG